MTLLILIDTNVPMYVWGARHPIQEPSRDVMRLATDKPKAFFTDAEVLQEMLHRYRALHHWPSGQQAISAFATLLQGRIEPLIPEDVLSAAQMAGRYPSLSARDLVHVAVAIRAGATHIVSADMAFDVIEEIERLDPMRVAEWRDRVIGDQ